MLLKDLYRIVKKSVDKYSFSVTILINPEHIVFKGHFPEQPVVPGVVQLQIVKELMEKHLDKKLMLNKVTQVKYLVPVIPDEEVEIIVNISFKEIDEKEIKVDATLDANKTLFTKAKLGFA